MKRRDGEERKVPAELLYSWVEGDSSVGLPSGWVLIGLFVGDREFDLTSKDDLHALETLGDTFEEEG